MQPVLRLRHWLRHAKMARVGTPVRIRSEEEILATLDEKGTLDGLPFMPEMVKFCGSSAVVVRSAHKTCDSQAIRRMRRTVHLGSLSCDGSSHGGCQLRCGLFWRTEWLGPVEDLDSGCHAKKTSALATRSDMSTRLHGRSPANNTFACQATEVSTIAAELSWWRPLQYLMDVLSGNVPLQRVLRRLPLVIFNGYQDMARRTLPESLWVRGGRYIPSVLGTVATTPTSTAVLVAGDKVTIKRLPEVLESLDSTGRNRGLSFDWEMISECGDQAVVERRVTRLIDEQTGRLRVLNNPTVVLLGSKCTGDLHRFCPRQQDSLWREIWLNPVTKR